ncbi:MAG: nitrate reductase associated protein [Xenococcaceae cyanobacterium]
MSDEQSFFAFEADFVDSLRCIPMVVRMKLDTCGVKLKLAHWNQFDEIEKQALIEKPCENVEESSQYREFLQNLVEKQTGVPAGELPIESNPAWLDINVVPIAIQEKATELNLKISLEQWQQLTPLQRFALIKLSRPSHENHNFLPALKEFQLI